MERAWYFLAYSALGFLLEVGFSRITGSGNRGRKCLLFLPLCPVYGLGASLILLLPRSALFPLWAAAVATGAEYAAGQFYSRCWRVRFWDYAGLPCQLHGQVCLPFSLLWGLLALPMTDAVQPILHQLWLATGPGITAGLLAAFLADTICTTLVLERDPRVEALRWWESPPAKGWRTLKSE